MVKVELALILIPLEVQDHTVPHFKALRHGKHKTRGHICGYTSSICKAVLKSDNLQHKQGFVYSQAQTTVNIT